MDINSFVRNRISELLQRNGMKQADLVATGCVKKAHLSRILKGEVGVSLETLSAICDALFVSLSDFFQPFPLDAPLYLQRFLFQCKDLSLEEVNLLSDTVKHMKTLRHSTACLVESSRESPSNESGEDIHGVHVLGEAAAGLPLYNEAFPDEFIDLPAKYADPDRYRIIRARGNSMEPKIFSGDIVVAEIDVEPFDGQIALVFLAGLADDEYTIKRVYREHGKAVLRSFNSEYQDMIYDLKAIRSCERVVEIVPGSRK